jgi:hypothetical protein
LNNFADRGFGAFLPLDPDPGSRIIFLDPGSRVLDLTYRIFSESLVKNIPDPQHCFAESKRSGYQITKIFCGKLYRNKKVSENLQNFQCFRKPEMGNGYDVKQLPISLHRTQ